MRIAMMYSCSIVNQSVLWTAYGSPTPPRKKLLSLSTGYESGHITDAILLRTIELSQVTGLTIFYALGSAMSIHAHTAKAPLATKTYERFPAYTKRFVGWVYVPLARNDRVLLLGIRARRAYIDKCTFLVSPKPTVDSEQTILT